MHIPFIRDIYAAFGRADLPAVLAACAEDVDWRSVGPSVAPYTANYRGRGGAKRFFESFLANVRLTKFEPHEFLAAGDTVVVLGREGGTVVSTGRTTEYDWVHVFVVKHGQIVSFREFVDAPAIETAFRG